MYRDHLKGEFPLLPWLHSSETCEHVFGEARQIVKDFTMLDLFYMLTKLRVKLREAVLGTHSANFKARTAGYCHTYFDTTGADMLLLSVYPTDGDIQDAADQAMEECESIIALLGVQPAALQAGTTGSNQLPAINSWYNGDDVDTEDGSGSDRDSEIGKDGPTSDATELQEIMDYVENTKVVFSQEQEDQITRLSCAAIALINDNMTTVYAIPACLLFSFEC